MNSENPKVFISYSWDNIEHKSWVKDFATKLREDGVDVSLDQWKLIPGDQLTKFMEKEIRENDFVLIICTPKYKSRSDSREGGVGYEGDIMTAEILNNRNERKFIPILRNGDWSNSAPSWLLGKYFIDLKLNPIDEQNYNDLLTTLYNQYPQAPALGKPKLNATLGMPDLLSPNIKKSEKFEEIKIIGVIADEVGVPRNDGSRGSALYKIPFLLSAKPSFEWSQLFIENWNHPPMFTSMHRPGIAQVVGKKIILERSTLEEVKKYHRDTLILAVNETNKRMKQIYERKREEEERKMKQIEEHKKNVNDISKDIKFD